MAKFQVIKNGGCVNLLSVDDSATLVQGSVTLADSSVLAPPDGATIMNQPGAEIGWVVSGDVLIAPVEPPPPPMTKIQLFEYANALQWRLATGGHQISIGGTSYLFPTDSMSLSLMTGKAVRLQLPGAPTSVDWQVPSGYVTFSASDFLTCAAALADWMQATFEALKPVLAAIQSGLTTTTGQIDAAIWPTP